MKEKKNNASAPTGNTTPRKPGTTALTALTGLATAYRFLPCELNAGNGDMKEDLEHANGR